MDLSEIRKRIDELDDRLLSLFEDRMALSALVAEQKAKLSLPLVNADREKEILARLKAKADDATAPYVEGLFELLFSASKDYQSRLLAKNK